MIRNLEADSKNNLLDNRKNRDTGAVAGVNAVIQPPIPHDSVLA